MRMRVCVHECMCARLYVCMNVCVHECMCARVYVWHECTGACVRSVCIYMCVACMCLYVYVCLYIVCGVCV